jgi:hypothetical protein
MIGQTFPGVRYRGKIGRNACRGPSGNVADRQRLLKQKGREAPRKIVRRVNDDSPISRRASLGEDGVDCAVIWTNRLAARKLSEPPAQGRGLVLWGLGGRPSAGGLTG